VAKIPYYTAQPGRLYHQLPPVVLPQKDRRHVGSSSVRYNKTYAFIYTVLWFLEVKILILCGGSFIAPFVAESLHSWGHDLTLFGPHQSTDCAPKGVASIPGDRSTLSDFGDDLKDIAADVIIDMSPSTVDEVDQLKKVLDGDKQRVVLVSSCEVYRAYGRWWLTEPGEPDLVPLLEDDPLREKAGPTVSHKDFVGMEKAVRESSTLSPTILRLPVVYGPGDPMHEVGAYVSQMDNSDDDIILTPKQAEWRCSSGYAKDMGYAIALAAKNKKAAGQIYNVADSFAFTQRDWIRAIARAADWQGTVRVEPLDCDPSTFNYDQHIIVDSTKIRQELGYTEQTPINDALKKTVNWERSVSSKTPSGKT